VKPNNLSIEATTGANVQSMNYNELGGDFSEALQAFAFDDDAG